MSSAAGAKWSLAVQQANKKSEEAGTTGRTEAESQTLYNKMADIEWVLDDERTGNGAKCIYCQKVFHWRNMYSVQMDAEDETKFHSSLSLKNEIHAALMTDLQHVAAMIASTAACRHCLQTRVFSKMK